MRFRDAPREIQDVTTLKRFENLPACSLFFGGVNPFIIPHSLGKILYCFRGFLTGKFIRRGACEEIIYGIPDPTLVTVLFCGIWRHEFDTAWGP